MALKIAKAGLAVPMFALWLPAHAALSLACLVWETAELAGSLVGELATESAAFWRKPWFRGFSRAYYGSLSHYKAKPVPFKASDE